MKNRNEIKPYLEYTNEEGEQFFYVGDHIICRTEDGKRYIGRIATICRYQESEETELEGVIYLNTFQNKMIYSGEIIKIADITYICKNPVSNLYGYPHIDEKQDQSRFINMIVTLGHGVEKAEIMYRHMKELIALYNIPLSSILSSAIQEIDLCTDEICQNELIEIADKAMRKMLEVLQSVTNSIRENWENNMFAVNNCPNEQGEK